MARKYGQVAKISKNFYDYNYIITGVASIGKTHLVHHLGIAASNSNEGTFIITCGREPKPTHIPNNPFYEHAVTFKDVLDIIKDVTENKNDYPDTKFIAFDSLDELYRIAEQYVITEWNNQCKIDERAKSISQAYKGFQKGENRVCDLVVKVLGMIEDAGLHWIIISHTKNKTQTDMYSGVSFEQITSSVDAKYYNVVKDKANLVATCYYEKEIADIEEVKDAFSKKMKKKGNLISQKKIIVFRDDDNAIDCKSHFAYIEPKIDFSVENFIKAVTDAIERQATGSTIPTNTNNKIEESINTAKAEDEDSNIDLDIFEDEATEEETVNKEELMAEIRGLFSKADKDTKTRVKNELKSFGASKLDDSLTVEQLNTIKSILD